MSYLSQTTLDTEAQMSESRATELWGIACLSVFGVSI
jgi:hypothetical protein